MGALPLPIAGNGSGARTLPIRPQLDHGDTQNEMQNEILYSLSKNCPSSSRELTKYNLFRGVPSYALATREVIFKMTHPLVSPPSGLDYPPSWRSNSCSIRGEACWLSAQGECLIAIRARCRLVSCIYGIAYMVTIDVLSMMINTNLSNRTVGRLQPRSGSDSPTELVLHARPLYCRLYYTTEPRWKVQTRAK